MSELAEVNRMLRLARDHLYRHRVKRDAGKWVPAGGEVILGECVEALRQSIRGKRPVGRRSRE